MDVLKFFTVRLCPWDMHLTGRRRNIVWSIDFFSGYLKSGDVFFFSFW